MGALVATRRTQAPKIRSAAQLDLLAMTAQSDSENSANDGADNGRKRNAPCSFGAELRDRRQCARSAHD